MNQRMKSFSSVGLGLSLVFTCLLVALIAEIYYLLWWKNKVFIGRGIEDDYSNPGRNFFFYMLCWKRKLSSSAIPIPNTHQEFGMTSNPVSQLHSHKDCWLKCLDEHQIVEEAEELFLGPPGFLFTIKEETKEDLESEDWKSREGKQSTSLNELLNKGESTPYLTPFSSPPFFTPPLTPSQTRYNIFSLARVGYMDRNTFCETSADSEFNKMRASPPPKFKFLRDAEDKLQRRNMVEEEESKNKEDGSFIKIIVGKNKERETNHHYHSPHECHSISSSSSSSQVLPFAPFPFSTVGSYLA